MSLWKVQEDAANNAPVFTVDAATGRSGTQNYGNTTVGVTGVFGVGVAESAVARANGTPVSPGWVARKELANGRVQQEVLVAVSAATAVNFDEGDVEGGDGEVYPDSQT
jgi:hypothetical protein